MRVNKKLFPSPHGYFSSNSPRSRGRRSSMDSFVDGGDGGGGGPLSPLFILFIVSSLQFLDGSLDYLKKRRSRSSEQTQIRQEIRELLREASTLSTPSTFAQAAKLRRMAAAKEKELIKKQEEQDKESSFSYDNYTRALLYIKVVLFAGLSWLFWRRPVAIVPQHLLQPFGMFFPGSATAGLFSVGIIPWLVLTSRVSKFLCRKLFTVVSFKQLLKST